MQAEAQFWQRVLGSDPPEPVSYQEAQQRWHALRQGGAAAADEDTLAAWRELCSVRGQIKDLAAREDELKTRIACFLGERDADTLVHGSGQTLLTWKAGKAPARFDAKAFAAAHPGLYAQYLKTGQAQRSLLIKETTV